MRETWFVARHMAQPLETACAICGQKALYRWDQEGRCREHRFIVSQACRVRQMKIEARATREEAWHRDRDAVDRLRASLHRCKRAMKGRP